MPRWSLWQTPTRTAQAEHGLTHRWRRSHHRADRGPAAASPLRVPKVLWARVRAEARRVGRQAAAEARQAAAARRQSEMAAAAARVEDSLAAADASGDESLLVPSAAVEPSWMWPAPRSAASPKTGGSWVDRLARGCLAPVYDFIDAAKQAAAEQEAGREDEARRTRRAAASPLKVKAGSPVRGSGSSAGRRQPSQRRRRQPSTAWQPEARPSAVCDADDRRGDEPAEV